MSIFQRYIYKTGSDWQYFKNERSSKETQVQHQQHLFLQLSQHIKLAIWNVSSNKEIGFLARQIYGDKTQPLNFIELNKVSIFLDAVLAIEMMKIPNSIQKKNTVQQSEAHQEQTSHVLYQQHQIQMKQVEFFQH